MRKERSFSGPPRDWYSEISTITIIIGGGTIFVVGSFVKRMGKREKGKEREGERERRGEREREREREREKEREREGQIQR